VSRKGGEGNGDLKGGVLCRGGRGGSKSKLDSFCGEGGSESK
jgi:hypothetical protein